MPFDVVLGVSDGELMLILGRDADLLRILSMGVSGSSLLPLGVFTIEIS